MGCLQESIGRSEGNCDCEGGGSLGHRHAAMWRITLCRKEEAQIAPNTASTFLGSSFARPIPTSTCLHVGDRHGSRKSKGEARIRSDKMRGSPAFFQAEHFMLFGHHGAAQAEIRAQAGEMAAISNLANGKCRDPQRF